MPIQVYPIKLQTTIPNGETQGTFVHRPLIYTAYIYIAKDRAEVKLSIRGWVRKEEWTQDIFSLLQILSTHKNGGCIGGTVISQC